MRKQKLHSLTIVLGTIMALAIVFFQVFQIQTFSQAKKQDVKSEQKDASHENETIISVPSIPLPSSTHVQLNQDVYCIFEILCLDSSEKEEASDFPIITPKFFRTLFRVIIAPNAP